VSTPTDNPLERPPDNPAERIGALSSVPSWLELDDLLYAVWSTCAQGVYNRHLWRNFVALMEAKARAYGFMLPAAAIERKLSVVESKVDGYRRELVECGARCPCTCPRCGRNVFRWGTALPPRYGLAVTECPCGAVRIGNVLAARWDTTAPPTTQFDADLARDLANHETAIALQAAADHIVNEVVRNGGTDRNPNA